MGVLGREGGGGIIKINVYREKLFMSVKFGIQEER